MTFTIESEHLENPPWNYLPIALQAKAGLLTAEAFGLIPTRAINAREDFKPVFKSASDVSDTNQFSELTQENEPLYLIPQGDLVNKVQYTAPIAKVDSNEARENLQLIGLIDFGIAFWNPKLSKRIIEMGYLSFDASKVQRPLVEFIEKTNPGQLATYNGMSEKSLLDALSANYPQSAHGQGLFKPRGLNHGTAMADLALRTSSEERAMIGIELPANLVLDTTGDALSLAIGFALNALITRAQEIAQDREKKLKLRIVFAFGFMGGPDDGSHPMVQEIENTLKALEDSVELMIPMGNHRQDQLFAAFGVLKARAKSPHVTWFLEPDDHSENAVDICYHADDPPILSLTTPTCDAISIPLTPGTLHWIMQNGNIIGAVTHNQTSTGMTRARLCLLRTASIKDPAPFGAWQLQIEAQESDVENLKFHVLRDDGPLDLGTRSRTRQSRLRDTNYQKFDDTGDFLMGDTSGSSVQRLGSASIIAQVRSSNATKVAATENRGQKTKTAFYSGDFRKNGPPSQRVIVDPKGPLSGQWALGNGTPREFKVTGTSVAAALA